MLKYDRPKLRYHAKKMIGKNLDIMQQYDRQNIRYFTKEKISYTVTIYAGRLHAYQAIFPDMFLLFGLKTVKTLKQ